MDEPSSGARAQGDEADLFRSFDPALLRSVAHAVRAATPEVIEDACAHAWAAFLEHQPDRTDDWRGWLIRTAERHAMAIERARREEEPLEPAAIGELRAGRADLSVRDDVNEVLSVIAALPRRLQKRRRVAGDGVHAQRDQHAGGALHRARARAVEPRESLHCGAAR